MKRFQLYILLGIVAVCSFSCRWTGDDLLSYGQNDTQAFLGADTSYVEQFKVLWTALNENYGIWDYEESFGMDWDKVYEEFLPKFKALEDTARKTPVTDDELMGLYSQFLDSLHDGHTAFLIKNLQTGKSFVICPQEDRNIRERGKLYEDEKTITTLEAYQTTAVASNYQIKAYAGTGSTDIMIEALDTMANRMIRYANNYMALVDAKGGPDETNDSIYKVAQNIKKQGQTFHKALTDPSSTRQVLEASIATWVSQYNAMCTSYAAVAKQIGLEMKPIDTNVLNDQLGKLYYALFPENIAYLRIGGFELSSCLEPSKISTDVNSLYHDYQMAVNHVWHQWFDTIQALHKSEELGGIIIDVRNNGGGSVNDYKYVVGSLVQEDCPRMMRVKNGTGRLDYTPLLPGSMPVNMDTARAKITKEPIVVLANCHSVSLAENTTWGVKAQPNGHFIGTRTYGALSALNTSPEDYSETYSGAFGVEGVTSVYGYLPKFVFFYPIVKGEYQIVEGKGFEPDEVVELDVDLWKSQKRDNQLEKAIDYIRSPQ